MLKNYSIINQPQAGVAGQGEDLIAVTSETHAKELGVLQKLTKSCSSLNIPTIPYHRVLQLHLQGHLIKTKPILMIDLLQRVSQK